MTQLSIPFSERVVPFASEGSSWEEFRKFSPSGKVPCLIDGDTTVWDSLAITEYVAETYSHVWPSDKRARAWARSAAAEMHSSFGALREQCSMSCGIRVRLHDISSSLRRDVQRLCELWQQGLEQFGGPFLAGAQFCAADAFFAPVAFRVQTYQLELTDVAQRYVQRLLALESMQRWYRDALREPWRDQSHEEEVPRFGVIIEDLRTA